jgi:hypothetical protein
MHIRISSSSDQNFPRLGNDSFNVNLRHANLRPTEFTTLPMDDADIRDTPFPDINPTSATGTQNGNALLWLLQLLEKFFTKDEQPSTDSPKSSPRKSPTSNTPPVDTTPTSSTPASGNYATSLQEAAAKTNPQFKPIIRGDEAQQDAKIHDQASFARAADQVAKEYGLDPNMFRAQLQKESGAFSQGYEKAMRQEGDLGRASENNTSIGLGQISRKFLDGREWSDGGPNNPRVGGQTVTTEQYMNSPITQLRIAAANDAMRIADHGGLEPGLLYYVSGHATRDAQNGDYLDSIDKLMHDASMMNLGR